MLFSAGFYEKSVKGAKGRRKIKVEKCIIEQNSSVAQPLNNDFHFSSKINIINCLRINKLG